MGTPAAAARRTLSCAAASSSGEAATPCAEKITSVGVHTTPRAAISARRGESAGTGKLCSSPSAPAPDHVQGLRRRGDVDDGPEAAGVGLGDGSLGEGEVEAGDRLAERLALIVGQLDEGDPLVGEGVDGRAGLLRTAVEQQHGVLFEVVLSAVDGAVRVPAGGGEDGACGQPARGEEGVVSPGLLLPAGHGFALAAEVHGGGHPGRQGVPAGAAHVGHELLGQLPPAPLPDLPDVGQGRREEVEVGVHQPGRQALAAGVDDRSAGRERGVGGEDREDPIAVDVDLARAAEGLAVEQLPDLQHGDLGMCYRCEQQGRRQEHERSGPREEAMRLTDISGYHLLLVLAGVAVFSGAHLLSARPTRREDVARVVLMYAVGIIGFHGFINFVAHTAFADEVAASIGWAAGSPFQTEVAGANLGIGLIGFLGFWRRSFWLPFIFAKTGFMWTAGVAHIIDIVENGNLAINNAGPMLWWDLAMPVALMILYRIQAPSTMPLPHP